MNISIIRYRLKEATNSIDGTLYIDGSRICDTAENAQFHIPVGTYAIEATKCQVQKRNIPVISLTSHPSSLPLCRNCEACALVADKNEKASLKIINAIHHVMEKGKAEGKPEEVYMQEARAMEASQPKHAPRDPMPFCPQIKAGNSAWHETDGGIIVGQYLQPGVVIKSRPMFEAIYERIRKNIERQKQRELNGACSNSAESRPGVDVSQRGAEVTVTITEDYKFKY